MNQASVNPLNLEAEINRLESTDFLESEPLISQCFEFGFFPWDNPKFTRLLFHRIQSLLDPIPEWGRSAVRGGMYARLTIDLTEGDTHNGWIAMKVKQLLSNGCDRYRWVTVPELVQQSERRSNVLLNASLRRAKTKLNLT